MALDDKKLRKAANKRTHAETPAAKSASARNAAAIKDAPASKPIPKKVGDGGRQWSLAEQYNGYAALGALAGWVLLLLGQRIFAAEEGMAQFFTLVGVTALIASFGQRVWALTSVAAARKAAARAFAVLSGVGLLALVTIWASTDSGRGTLGFDKPTAGQPDPFGDMATVFWVTLLLMSLLPSIMGELARRSMLRAERMESRRVVAAVVAGLTMSCAVAYSALFTYSAGKVDWSMDFSYFRVAKPSDATARMLDTLETPLKVLVFFPSHSEVRIKVVRYLEELQKKTAKLEIEVHDRLLVPDLAKEHKVRKDGELVLVREKMSETLDIGVDEEKAARTLKKLDGEFQKVLLKAMRDKRTVYLTVGHGELNEDTDKQSLRTVSLMRQLIESQNYAIKNLGLSQGLGDKAPDDADVIAILGPTEPFSEREIETLRRYADDGGRVLMALDPDAGIDLAPLAAAVGVSWQKAVVINDQVLYRMKRDDSDKKILVAKRFSSHASVSTLSKLAARGAAVLIPGAAPLDQLSDKDYNIDFAVKSVPGSYIDLNGNWAYDADNEKKATYNLVAAVSKPVVPSEDSQKKPTAGGDKDEMRAFVIGDADLFTDPVIDYAKTNRLLFLEALRWLGGEESFSGEITEEEDVAIVQTKQEDQVWFYTAVLGVPSLVAGGGLAFTRRRRKRKTTTAPSKPTRPAKAAADAEADAEADADADAAAESDSDPDSEAAPDSDADSDSPPDSDADPGSDPDPDADSDEEDKS
jgi:hypothetical protein